MFRVNDRRLVGVHILLMILLTAAGCTSLRPVEGESESLQQQIRDGAAVQVGDRVEVVTDRGETHTFKVTRIGSEMLAGDGVEVPIDSVRSLQIRELDKVKTGATVAGVGLGFYLIMALLLIAAGPALIL